MQTIEDRTARNARLAQNFREARDRHAKARTDRAERRYSPDQPRRPNGEFGTGGDQAKDSNASGAATVSSDDKAGGKNTKIVENVLAGLPSEHTDGLSEIAFEKPGMLDNDGSADTFGSYINHDRQIVLSSMGDKFYSKADEREQLNAIASHEIGHFVHQAKLTADAADQWARISNNGENARITDYASTDTREHFAEAYASYALGGTQKTFLSLVEPKSYAFMDKLFKEPSSMVVEQGTLVPVRVGNKRCRLMPCLQVGFAAA